LSDLGLKHHHPLGKGKVRTDLRWVNLPIPANRMDFPDSFNRVPFAGKVKVAHAPHKKAKDSPHSVQSATCHGGLLHEILGRGSTAVITNETEKSWRAFQ